MVIGHKKTATIVTVDMDVESPRIELGSKQGSKEPSTRLVSDWIFDRMLGQKQPHST